MRPVNYLLSESESESDPLADFEGSGTLTDFSSFLIGLEDISFLIGLEDFSFFFGEDFLTSSSEK